MKPKVGDAADVFWRDAIIIEVVPYQGRYSQFFKWTVRCTARRTARGWMEYCV